MAKKGGFSFSGMVDPDAASEPIQGVSQRGEDAPKRRGRPQTRDKGDPRPSFSLDPQTHALFKIWLLREGLTMQEYLERHIAELVAPSR